MNVLHSEIYKGVQIQICQDEDAPNPRTEWDNLTRMACFHNRYELGDKDHCGYRPDDYQGWSEMEADIVTREKPVVIRPLFLFDHSGLSIACDAAMFRACDSHGWDWGQVGFVWVPRKAANDNFGFTPGRKLTTAQRRRVLGTLEAEVHTYDDYLQGNCYGWIVGEPFEDSCWGYYLSADEHYDDEDGTLLTEARSTVDIALKNKETR